MRLVATALLFIFTAGMALAEQSVTVGPHVVHYSAISTDQLDPMIARNYGITRSKNRAMINVAVLRNDADGQTPVKAEISAAASNRNGQRREIMMRLVEEQSALYYLGFVRVSDQETLSFEASVTPDGAASPIEIRFEQQFFVN